MADSNIKHDLFVAEYLKDLNATRAYLAVYPRSSRKAAEVSAHQLLRKPKIAAAIQKAAAKRIERVEVDADTVLRELLRLSMVDLKDAYNEDGSLKPIHEIPEDIRRAVAGVEVDEIKDWVENEDGTRTKEVVGYTRKLKFWDKRGSLELLGKHLKLFTEKVEVSGSLTLEQAIAQSRGR